MLSICRSRRWYASCVEGDDHARSDGARVPHLSEDVDPTSLPINPFQGFILSRIDGQTTLQDIADSTSATLEQVVELMNLLEGIHAISWVEPPVLRPPTSPPQKRRKKLLTKSTKPPPPKPESDSKAVEPDPLETEDASRPTHDQTDLDEDVELDEDRRQLILDMHSNLEHLDYYALLGVSRDAEKKEIRAEYFRLSKQFHPDTLFGKRLGSYKARMETVFKKLTDAYETLSKKKKRKKYDEYLQVSERLAGVEEDLRKGEKAADALHQELHLETPEVALTEPPSSAQPKAPAKSINKPSPRSMLSAEERRKRARELLERRLRGSTSRKPTSPKPSPVPTKHPEARLRGLASSLKNAARFTGGVRVERHLNDADEAERRNDIVGAVNALRLALALLPNRTDLQQRIDGLNQRLLKDLADTYEKQALYEEEQEKWIAAARSWAKVAEGRPDQALPARRAAEAFLKGGADLRSARDLAQRAVHIKPNSLENRLVLGQVYAEAGMTASARKELEAAAKLDPNSEIVKNRLNQLK